MTAKIIPFPPQDGPDLAETEQKIKAVLTAMTGDPALTDQVAGQMMTFIQNYTCKTIEPEFNLPAPPMTETQRQAFRLALDAGIETIIEQVQDMISKIVQERLLREVEIYEELAKLTAAQTSASLKLIHK